MSDRAQRDLLVARHRYLCERAARRFHRPGVDVADLEQVGALGLIKAADRFDPATSVPFEAYAWRLVIGELMHYVRDSERILRAPRRMRALEQRWLSAEREFWVHFGREPAPAEIASHCRMTLEEWRDLRQYRATGRTVSFESLKPVDQRSLAYTIESELDRINLENVVSGFPPLEQRIIREIYELDTPPARLAVKLGYSRRHLARLHRRILQKLAVLARTATHCTGSA